MGDEATQVRLVAVATLAEGGDATVLPALAEAFWHADGRATVRAVSEHNVGFEYPDLTETYITHRCLAAIVAIAEAAPPLLAAGPPRFYAE